MPQIKVLDSISIPLDQRLEAQAAAKERSSRLTSTSSELSQTPF